MSDTENINDDAPYQLPDMEFEFVENVNSEHSDSADELADDNQQYAFPLFSFGGATSVNTESETLVNDTKESGEQKAQTEQLIKVSLVDEEEEYDEAVKRINHRPDSFYFKKFTSLEKEQFQKSCIDTATIIKGASDVWNTAWRQYDRPVIDLLEYNANIEKLNKRVKALKHKTPGKRQRDARKQGKQNQLDRETKRMELKKKFRKRGGKKNKKPSALAHAGKDQQAPPLKPIVKAK